MLTAGAKVMGEWTPGKWYPGRIGEAASDGSRYFVVFDDGDRAWLTPERIAPMLPPSTALPAVGARVLGQWSNGHWYLGRVSRTRPEEAFIEFDDGDTAWLRSEKIAAISAPVSAPGNPLEGLVLGARVMGEWSTGAWYPGAIAQIRPGEFFVQFDDGDQAW